MTNNSYSISIVLPAYNESKNIKQTLDDANNFLENSKAFESYEIIVVDDGSTDNTSMILDELKSTVNCLKVITHPKNKGYGRALSSGILETQFPWVLLMDADGQFKLSSLDSMLGYFSDYDIISGYRYKRRDPLGRILLGKTYSFLASSLFGLKIRDINCGFKLFRRETLDLEGLKCHAGVFYTKIFIKTKAKGYKIKEVPVEHFPRTGGKQTGASLKVVWESISDVFRLKFLSRSVNK